MSSTPTRTPDVGLREVRDEDLDALFEFQRDPVAVPMVGIGSRSREDFDAHWARIRTDAGTVLRTITADGAVAGWAVVFTLDGRRNLGYWLGREFWGRGVASAAVTQLLAEVSERPLWGVVLAGNRGSRRVLEKHGFEIVDEGDEVLYLLEG